MRLFFSAFFLVATAWADGEFKATLTGTQEIPLNLSKAEGAATVKFIANPKSLEVKFGYSGLEGTPAMAHLHLGQEHQNGSIVAFLCGGGGKPACPTNGGQLTVTVLAADIQAVAAQGLAAGDIDAFMRAIEEGVVYANIHTSKYPAGEIRGQLGRGLGKGKNKGGKDDDEDEEEDDDKPGKGPKK